MIQRGGSEIIHNRGVSALAALHLAAYYANKDKCNVCRNYEDAYIRAQHAPPLRGTCEPIPTKEA